MWEGGQEKDQDFVVREGILGWERSQWRQLELGEHAVDQDLRVGTEIEGESHGDGPERDGCACGTAVCTEGHHPDLHSSSSRPVTLFHAGMWDSS